jgi:hypothetical protein
MRKKLAMALAAGALVAAMLPGVASADVAQSVGSPIRPRTSARNARPSAASVDRLVQELNAIEKELPQKIREIKAKGGEISIADMFEMQLLMNELEALSESIDEVVSASNTAIQPMARNVKG